MREHVGGAAAPERTNGYFDARIPTSTGGNEAMLDTTKEQIEREKPDQDKMEKVESRRPSVSPERDADVEDNVAEPVARPMARSAATDANNWKRTGATQGPQRSDTAPLSQQRSLGQSAQRRPKLAGRNTVIDGLRRAGTATQMNYKPRQPYSYRFDPMSSESESSSSSSEEEAPIKRRKTKETKQQEAKAPNDAEKQKKEDAKQGQSYSRFRTGNGFMNTKGRVSKRDGRLSISINDTSNSGYVAKALGQSIKHHLDIPRRKNPRAGHDHTEEEKIAEVRKKAGSVPQIRTAANRPKLNIVIMVIGSRGDIQPFLKVGKVLQNQYGHRVRIATHPAFRDFVQNDAGLEFFSVGGNPSELMAFMVKNPGLIPNMQTIKDGEIGRRRDQMAEMFDGFWRACTNSTDDEKDKLNLRLMGERAPFIADAIIANPPSMAHVHIAERLGIPLHMMFTFPYSPTQQFPHPLANINPNKSNVEESYVNFMSYPMVEMMTFQGLGDLINAFRVKRLGLELVSSLWAPGALYRMKVPYTYMWSPSLVPKPKDWGPEIDIGGFVFLDLASDFKPPKDLSDFLAAGEPPVYIGFGSIVVDDPEKFTQMIFKAVKIAGVRALVNKGWGGIGGEGKDTPEGIFMLDNTPHDWLFPKVKAVVHHGGAGTTAIGLKCGKPTMIVPFFGDQPFWGAMVAEAKAGAHECIPYKKLNAERLAEGIKQCLSAESQQNVQKIADSIVNEGDGAENAVKSFHRSLPLAGRKSMRCSILEDHVAVWSMGESSLRLSALAAELLVEEGRVKWSELKLLRHYQWNDFDGPGEPITGTTSAIATSLYGIGEGVGMVPVRIAEHVRKREKHEAKRKAIAARKEEKKQAKAAAKAQIEKSTATDRPVDDEPAPPQQYADNGGRPNAQRGETNTTLGSTLSADPSEPLAQEMAGDIGRGFRRSGAALLTMPMDLHMAIAQGFHNAPRLYGDATVRKPVRITGMKSGWTAARKEFGYGIYDSWTGLVTQPVGGWKDEVTVPAKFAGMGKGVARGLGGFVLKNVTALIAPPAYLGQGARKYVEKKLGGPGANSFIRKAHIVQGMKDLQAIKDDPEKLQRAQELVDQGWRVYEEIWQEVNVFKQSAGPGPIGKMKFLREKKRWEQEGALENIHTAEQALRARKEGKDVHGLFERRKREVRLAEAPRAGAMEQPENPGEAEGVLENGRRKQSEDAAADATTGQEAQSEQVSGGRPSAIKEEEEKESSQPTVAPEHARLTEGRLSRDRGESDTTAVGSDNETDDKNNKADGGAAAQRLQSAGEGIDKLERSIHTMDAQPPLAGQTVQVP